MCLSNSESLGWVNLQGLALEVACPVALLLLQHPQPPVASAAHKLLSALLRHLDAVRSKPPWLPQMPCHHTPVSPRAAPIPHDPRALLAAPRSAARSPFQLMFMLLGPEACQKRSTPGNGRLWGCWRGAAERRWGQGLPECFTPGGPN